MIETIVAPISKAGARDILKGLISADPRFQRIPTIADAEQISEDLKRDRRLAVRPAYLLEVWCEFMKEGKA